MQVLNAICLYFLGLKNVKNSTLKAFTGTFGSISRLNIYIVIIFIDVSGSLAKCEYKKCTVIHFESHLLICEAAQENPVKVGWGTKNLKL